MADRWSDEAMLEALDMVERQGMTALATAKELQRMGVAQVSRSSVLGLVGRIRKDLEHSDNGNANGTMPERWWEEGLHRRRVAA